MSLNTQSPIPLYRQLALKLRDGIERGEFAIDERIPSEHVLASQYAIGRPTVRQATDLLVREGVLQRRRGAGTFVLPPTKRIDLFSLAGTSAALRDLPAVNFKLLSRQKIIKAPIYLPEHFNDRQVFEVRRLCRIEDEPVLLEVLYLDTEIFAGLERIDLNNVSLSKLAREHFHLEPTSAEQAFEIVFCDDELSGHLALDAGSAVLKVYRDIHFGEAESAIYSEIYCRTDQYRFTQSITTQESTQQVFSHAT